MKYQVNHGCTHCGTCIWECPVQAITIDSNGAAIDQEKCIGCGECVDNCASEAITPISELDQLQHQQ